MQHGFEATSLQTRARARLRDCWRYSTEADPQGRIYRTISRACAREASVSFRPKPGCRIIGRRRSTSEKSGARRGDEAHNNRGSAVNARST